MHLTSPAFTPNGMIPSRYTCDGADVSPPLSWDAPPAGTQSLVLIVDDPDAPVGTFVHWVLYNLPPQLRQIPEHLTPTTLPKGAIVGKNDFHRMSYGGPCPPGGIHRYFFKLYAVDRILNLPNGATKAQVMQAIEGHVLASAELIGRYARK